MDMETPVEEKKYILFGAGNIGRRALHFLGHSAVRCFSDNIIPNEEIDGKIVIPPNRIPEYLDKETEVVITVEKRRPLVEIAMQLNEMGVAFRLFEELADELIRKEAIEYERNNSHLSFRYSRNQEYIIYRDRWENAGTVNSYFWQDLWAAKRIIEQRPEVHYDIGSRLDGFISHLLSYGQKVNMIDIRPLPFHIEGLTFTQADATCLSSVDDKSIKSISALCSLEHFGLGRYGDDIDPDACYKAFDSIQKKMQSGGNIYISVPIGNEHLEFNAHRVFFAQTIVDCFENSELKEFSSCYLDEYIENIDIHRYDDWEKLGGDRFGLFWFVKR